MHTIDDVIRDATVRLRDSGSESARLDAELLLGHALGIERTGLLAHPELSVGPEAEARFHASLDRRLSGEPVAYIRGVKEFRGLAFSVDARALIPRPETERLVELAEAEVMRRLTESPGAPGWPLRIVDVGTGSGAIAVALMVALRRRGVGDEVAMTATEADPDTLQLAIENAVGHAVADRITFAEADLFPADGPAPFDLILANLPYVRTGAIADLPVATSFEPRRALDGGPDGLAVIRRLLSVLPERLTEPDGEAMLEIGGDQADEMRALVTTVLPGWAHRIESDLSGLPRVARISRS
jgi:release factor glutamine methyltransferase